MLARNAIRTARVVRVHPVVVRGIRRQSTVSSGSSSSSSSGSGSSAAIGGIVGGTVALAGFYGWYHFSGAKTLVGTAHSTKEAYQSMVKSLQQNTPEPSEALSVLKKTALSYAAFIPGAKGYVESAFDDLETVRSKRGHEVDKIVKEGYNELQDLSKKGDASLETAQKAWQILQKHLERLGSLTSDSISDLLDNHPELKKKVGGNIDQLKSLGDKYGPEAKKVADDSWNQVRSALKDGISPQSVEKVKQAVQDGVDKLRKFGDDAWNRGLEELKPQLEKNPKLKELLEKNGDKLKQGNISELWTALKKSLGSGNAKEAEEYIKKTVDSAQEQVGGKGTSISQLLEMIPGGSAISSKLSQLHEIAQEHGGEAEKLAKETYGDIQDVLQKKLSEAQKIANKAQEKAKND